MHSEGRTHEQQWYRVEHRVGNRVTVLGRVADVTRHVSTLDPWLSRLLLEGAAGELVLVEEATGAVIARRHLGDERPRIAGRTRSA